MKRLFSAVVLCAFCSMAVLPARSYAGEVDILLQKLVDKGVLTGPEAQEIKVQTEEEAKKSISAGTHETLPTWLQTMKMKGDFRLRYQYNHSKTVNEQTSERHRGRLRLRLGVESKVNSKLKVGLKLATGTSSSGGISADAVRSTNQSFDDEWSKKPFNLDEAWAQWSPHKWVDITAGKMGIKQFLWLPKDLMWDSDITPEGVNFDLHRKFADIDAWVKTGVYPIEESGSSGDDPMHYNIQFGAGLKPLDAVSVKGALTYYYFSLQGVTLSSAASGNTTPLEDFSIINPAFELKFSEPLTGLAEALNLQFLNVNHISLFGDFVHNTHAPADDNASGFMLGFKVSSAKKVADKGDWEFKYNFARLEKDAVPAFLPDSDRYGGKTNIRGHEVEFNYGVGKNTWIGFDIYRAQSLAAAAAPETIAQLDWNMKF